MLNSTESFIIILMIIASSFITRFLPFILFSKKNDSKYISYLGSVLPYASIGLLVVYCLKSITPLNAPYAMPELIAIVCIFALHYWKGNTLLSIGIGTAVYMLSVQYFF